MGDGADDASSLVLVEAVPISDQRELRLARR